MFGNTEAYRSITSQQEVLFSLESVPTQTISLHKNIQRGQLIIPGIKTPIQDLRVGFSVVKSIPNGHWPNFIFEYERIDKVVYPKTFAILPANNTVDGILSFLQYALVLNKNLWYTLKIGRRSYTLPLAPLPQDVEERFRRNAQICLKLKFIEEHFEGNIQPFTIPPTMSAEEVAATEHVYRALTEGEFSIYTNLFALMQMPPGSLDLGSSPFTDPGQLDLPSELDQKWNKNWKVPLLGQFIELGPMSYHFKMATTHNPDQIKRLRSQWNKPENIGIVSLDQEVTDRFDRYCKWHDRMKHNLQNFKTKLAQSEPKEFSVLVEESLITGISSAEAEKVALNWLIYNPLPNYYLPFTIVDNEDTDNWHVKVGMLNKEKTKGTGEIVGEIVINKKSGKVVDYPTFDFLWDKLINVIPISELPNEEILKLSKFRLSPKTEKAIDDLVEKNNESELNSSEQKELEKLLEVYGKSNVLKAEGLKIAVQRGLREPLYS